MVRIRGVIGGHDGRKRRRNRNKPKKKTPKKSTNIKNATHSSKSPSPLVNTKSTEGVWRASQDVKSRDAKLDRIWHSNAILKQESKRVKRESKTKEMFILEK